MSTHEISREKLETIANDLDNVDTVRGHDWAKTGAPVAVVSVVHPATAHDSSYFELVEVHASWVDDNKFYVARDSVLGLEDERADHMRAVSSVMSCASCYGNTVRHTCRKVA